MKNHLIQMKSVKITVTEEGKAPVVFDDVYEYMIIGEGKEPFFRRHGSPFHLKSLALSAFRYLEKLTEFT